MIRKPLLKGDSRVDLTHPALEVAKTDPSRRQDFQEKDVVTEKTLRMRGGC